jgi:hypothetical protein
MIDEHKSITLDSDTGRPVRVLWVDSGLSAGDGWQKVADLPTDVETVETIGLWMGENEHIVMVAGTRDFANESWLAVQLIWKNAITRKEWL